MGITLRQVKLFANGVKAVLQPATKKKQSVLRLFDKEGCMIAQREIQNRSQFGSRVLEKITLRSNKNDGNVETILKYNGGNGFRKEVRAAAPRNYNRFNVTEKTIERSGETYSHSYTDDACGLMTEIPLLRPASYETLLTNLRKKYGETAATQMVKKLEVDRTLNRMKQQWFNGKHARPQVKPMRAAGAKAMPQLEA